MNRRCLAAVVLPLVGLLCLPSCNEDRKRMDQRVLLLERQLADRKEQGATIRIVALVVLAGGAVAGLCFLGSSRESGSSRGSDSMPPEFRPPPSRPALPVWNDHRPVRDTRVIEVDPAAPTVLPPPALRPDPPRHRRRHQPRRRDPYREPNRNPY